jgi:hypothetical protein
MTDTEIKAQTVMTEAELRVQAMLVVAQRRLMLACARIGMMRAACRARNRDAVIEASGLLCEDLGAFEAAMNETSRLISGAHTAKPGPWGAN